MPVATKPTYEPLETRVAQLERLLLDQKRALEREKARGCQLEQENAALKNGAHTLSKDLQPPLDQVLTYLKFVEARYKGRLGPDADAFITSAVDGAEAIQRIVSALSTSSNKK
jgi:light-regulated signal transduction histidine kinase (bacteriophytochrome)